MPVPAHLRNIAFDESKRGTFTSFHLKCECGSDKFCFYKSFLNKEEQKLCEPYNKALDYVWKYVSTYTVDENGVGHHWIFPTDDLNGPKEEVFIPEKPVCAAMFAAKVRCAECGREYLIFDSSLHGYSGKYGEHSEEELRYEPHYKTVSRNSDLPVEIIVGLEYDESLEAFKEATGVDASYDDYADSFTWINIYSVNDKGNKRKVFEMETD